MQETWVLSLIWEDPTSQGAAKLMGHNYSACALEPRNRNYWSLRALRPVLHDKRNHHNEKPVHCNQRAAPARHS